MDQLLVEKHSERSEYRSLFCGNLLVPHKTLHEDCRHLDDLAVKKLCL